LEAGAVATISGAGVGLGEGDDAGGGGEVGVDTGLLETMGVVGGGGATLRRGVLAVTVEVSIGFAGVLARVGVAGGLAEVAATEGVAGLAGLFWAILTDGATSLELLFRR
jgi:hypothetical protein